MIKSPPVIEVLFGLLKTCCESKDLQREIYSGKLQVDAIPVALASIMEEAGLNVSTVILKVCTHKDTGKGVPILSPKYSEEAALLLDIQGVLLGLYDDYKKPIDSVRVGRYDTRQEAIDSFPFTVAEHRWETLRFSTDYQNRLIVKGREALRSFVSIENLQTQLQSTQLDCSTPPTQMTRSKIRL